MEELATLVMVTGVPRDFPVENIGKSENGSSSHCDDCANPNDCDCDCAPPNCGVS